MEAINHLAAVSRVNDFGPSMRANIATDVGFRLLQSSAAVPFPIRLARELAEATRAMRRDPVGFITSITVTGPVNHEERRRIRVGIIAAGAFYAVVLSGIYTSYVIFRHHVEQGVAPARHLDITYVAPPPMPIKKTVPLLKEASGASRKDLLTVPTQPSEQPKVELPEAKPTPRPPELTKTESTSPAPSAPYPATATASRDSASDDAPRGLEGNGVGAASGSGRGGSSNAGVNAGVNYNDVFSVSKVTTRPQILARPVPGYTEEARRAQVEGAVKLSVVLNANGTVSDITVARALGYGLDEKAIEAARELRFVPAQKDGHAVSVRIFLEFKFTLL
jgi:TonB family protein